MAQAPTRIPPMSAEAERALLGSILLDQNTLLLLRGKLQITPAMFYEPSHQVLAASLFAMGDAERMIDLTTFPQWLRDRGEIDHVPGGEEYLHRLVDETPTAAHAEYYADIVRKKHKARGLIEACRRGLELAWSEEDVDQAVSKTANSIHDLAQDHLTTARSNVEVFDELMERWRMAQQRRLKGDIPLAGLETPFGRLNELLGGLQPGLHFVAAPPSAGKTSIEGQMCEYVAFGEGPVLRVYLDDTHEDAIGRSCSRIGGVALGKLQHGFANNQDLQKLVDDVRPMLGKMAMYLHEDVETVEQICTLARLYKAKFGIRLLAVDYAQIVDTEADDRYMQERDRLAHVCAKLKRLWKELRLPILLLSQVQRENYKGDANPRKATMADLFGGAVLEHTASSVLILKTLSADDIAPQPIDADGYSFKFPVAAHLVKNKHGPTGMVPLWFYKKYFRFENTPTFMKGNVREYMTWEQQLEQERRQPRLDSHEG